ncbi:MAG: hypothetical protein A4E57_01081 [Syntrophorhabdaceae bacterium PtaU1.Bin034]|nr:MAG: hypothetical protein A4E57_01081 [Syntrophorhabdaceae bacterium PtaU1.Bin034]
MQLTIFLDRRIPEERLELLRYAWALIARSLRMSARITDGPTGERADRGETCIIFYGLEEETTKGEYHLFVPYEELTWPFQVKYLEGIPVLFGRREPLFLAYGRRLGFDAVSAVFSLISCEEERAACRTDELGRHVIGDSLFARLKLYDRPLANTYIEVLRRKIEEVSPARHVPEKAPFAIALSHDVDTLSRYSVTAFRNNLVSALHSREFASRTKLAAYAGVSLAAAAFKYVLRPRDARFLDEFCTLESTYGARSTFFLLPPRVHSASRLDEPHSYSEKVVYGKRWHEFAHAIRMVKDSGWEIGLHAGIGSFCDPLLLDRQRKALETIVGGRIWSVRHHLLQFNANDTWEAQERVRIEYDSTYGFNDHVGFRSCFCHPYKPFSLTKKREINVWEIPLVIQDKALFRMGGSYEEMLDTCLRALKEVQKWGGVAALLWHSDAVRVRRYPRLFDLYRSLLEWASQQSAFIGSIADAGDWWKAQMPEVRITHGAGSDAMSPRRVSAGWRA